MTRDLKAVRAVIYDLDGTVYDDTSHFEAYARAIQSHLDEEVQEAFWADYSAVLGGQHPALRIGTLYDVERDLVLEVKGGRVERALHWEGFEAPLLVRDQLYGDQPLQPDHRTLLNVGDLWWVPVAVSHHYGGQPERHQQSFLAIREQMSDPGFVMKSIPGLAESIESLRGRLVQVLVTNSPQPDSEAILTKVGLMGRFDRAYFSANKPAGLDPIIHELCRDFQIDPEAILSVGDNLVNEIAPARLLGCQTALIDPHGVADAEVADLVVPSMGHLLPTLRTLGA